MDRKQHVQRLIWGLHNLQIEHNHGLEINISFTWCLCAKNMHSYYIYINVHF
jgi:hypothetical protein